MSPTHLFGFGLILGLGAAMPLGPVNFEIMRRNLHFGTPAGLLLGLGAACTDLTYLIILSLGAITLLTHPDLLGLVGIAGSSLLFWFGIQAMRVDPQDSGPPKKLKKKRYYRHWVEGYLMTLLNPMTILFWASVSTQVALQTHTHAESAWWMGAGVIFAAYGWAVCVNMILHFTRHRIHTETLKWINRIGALLLVFFALLGIYRALIALGSLQLLFKQLPWS